MHPQTARAIKAIDEAVLIYVKAGVPEIKDLLAGWNRAVAEHEAGEPAAPSGPSATKHTPSTKLVSFNLNGNLHEVRIYLNQFGLSEFLVQAESGGNSSTVLLRMPIDWPCDGLGPKPATAT